MTNEEKFQFVIRHFEIIDGVLWSKPHISHAGWKCKARRMTTNANHPEGYCSVKINGKSLLAHQVLYMLYYNRPILDKMDIDHINGHKNDNSMHNLREISHRLNCTNTARNRGGKLPGTCYIKEKRKWRSNLQVNRRTVFIGYYSSEQEAHEAYLVAVDGLRYA
jgi:hypothetical protein